MQARTSKKTAKSRGSGTEAKMALICYPYELHCFLLLESVCVDESSPFLVLSVYLCHC